jgi:hypothetical protein
MPKADDPRSRIIGSAEDTTTNQPDEIGTTPV